MRFTRFSLFTRYRVRDVDAREREGETVCCGCHTGTAFSVCEWIFLFFLFFKICTRNWMERREAEKDGECSSVDETLEETKVPPAYDTQAMNSKQFTSIDRMSTVHQNWIRMCFVESICIIGFTKIKSSSLSINVYCIMHWEMERDKLIISPETLFLNVNCCSRVTRREGRRQSIQLIVLIYRGERHHSISCSDCQFYNFIERAECT